VAVAGVLLLLTPDSRERHKQRNLGPTRSLLILLQCFVSISCQEYPNQLPPSCLWSLRYCVEISSKNKVRQASWRIVRVRIGTHRAESGALQIKALRQNTPE
jgi:hypothetical protein